MLEQRSLFRFSICFKSSKSKHALPTLSSLLLNSLNRPSFPFHMQWMHENSYFRMFTYI